MCRGFCTSTVRACRRWWTPCLALLLSCAGPSALFDMTSSRSAFLYCRLSCQGRHAPSHWTDGAPLKGLQWEPLFHLSRGHPTFTICKCPEIGGIEIETLHVVFVPQIGLGYCRCSWSLLSTCRVETSQAYEASLVLKITAAAGLYVSMGLARVQCMPDIDSLVRLCRAEMHAGVCTHS